MPAVTPIDRTNERLDSAVIAHRENPTEETLREVMNAANEHNDAFMAEQARIFIERTRQTR